MREQAVKPKSDLKAPRLEKAVVNIGVGRLRQSTGAQFEEKILPEIMKELGLITGQKPAPRPAKLSIAGFKIRQGDIVGVKVTLRGRRLNDFSNRIINVVLPRVRDFKGLDQKAIDRNGNLSVGFKEQYVFPEISPDKSKISFGFEVTFVPRAKNREDAIMLYKSLGFRLK